MDGGSVRPDAPSANHPERSNMPTRPVDPEEVKALYQKWIEAGRPRVSDFARTVGMNCSTCQRWLNRYAIDLGIAAEDQLAALKGHAPDQDMTHVVPAPFVVKGVSTYYNKEGARAGQWVKTRLDDEAAVAAMRAAVEAFKEEIPRLPDRKSTRLNS